MTDPDTVAQHVQAALENVSDLRPAEELAAYEQVLVQLTELLDAPDEHGPELT